MRRHVPEACNVQTQHRAHPLPPTPNVLSCLLNSLIRTRHLNPIGHTPFHVRTLQFARRSDLDIAVCQT
jgi:hypothetical protein